MNFKVMKRIMSYAKPHSLYIIFTFILSVISVVATLYAPIVIGKGVDLIIGKGDVDFDSLFPILITLAIIVLVAGLSQWLMGVSTSVVTYRTVNDIRGNAFDRVTKVPLRYIDSTPHGDIISRIVTDADQISDGLMQGLNQLFSGLITILGTVIFMFTINFKITFIVILVTPLSLFVASFIARHTFTMFQKQATIRGEMTGFIEEHIGNQKVVKAFNRDRQNVAKFEQINKDLKKHGTSALFYSAISNPCTRFVNGIVYTAVAVFGAFSVISGQISVGQLSAFLSYSNQYTKPFNEISGVITELQNALASAVRIFAIIDLEEEIPDSDDAMVIKTVDGSMDIENVSFSYNENVKLIEGLNFSAKKGQRIAIVGPTGCGKSTIINLLMRFYDVDEGVIKVNGYDIKDVTRKSLRSCYGMVLQETWLFSGTIKENIAYGMPDATDEQIEQAAKAAFAHNFIRRLTNGYDTVISDDGSNISQGQKQLLCIARIMLTLPPMLILDEATSNIDTRTEINIQKAFEKMMEGRTSFIVAHRLSTIKEADCILVMNSGTIVEQGTHTELLEKNGFYAELYNSQFAIS